METSLLILQFLTSDYSSLFYYYMRLDFFYEIQLPLTMCDALINFLSHEKPHYRIVKNDN